MTQEEKKQLLLKDLCTRLPYGVIVATTNPAVPFGVVSGVSTKNKVTVETKHADIVFDCTEVKPYLRPISSMTTDEEYEYHQIRKRNSDKSLSLMDCSDHLQQLLFPIIVGTESINWLYSKHFNIILPKEAFVAITKENNPYKE